VACELPAVRNCDRVPRHARQSKCSFLVTGIDLIPLRNKEGEREIEKGSTKKWRIAIFCERVDTQLPLYRNRIVTQLCFMVSFSPRLLNPCTVRWPLTEVEPRYSRPFTGCAEQNCRVYSKGVAAQVCTGRNFRILPGPVRRQFGPTRSELEFSVCATRP
jgi:hypothetical protein